MMAARWLRVRRWRAETTPAKKPRIRNYFAPMVAEERDAEEGDVSSHGVGEDTAVIEEDEGVEEAAGAGEDERIG